MPRTLHELCAGGDAAAVAAQLARGADPNAANPLGHAPLFVAAFHGRPDCVRAVLADPRADPNAAKGRGLNALMGAAWKGEAECVRVLLAHPKTDVDARNEWGRTAAFYAAVQENIEVVDLLLARGADFSMPNLASERGNVDSFQLLDIPDAVRRRIVDGLAAREVDTSMLGPWLQPAPERDPTARLIQAAFTGDPEATKTLVQQLGANASDGWGHTPLMAAAFQNADGCADVVRHLLSLPDVAIDARDHFGRTAYYWAAAINSTEAMELLYAAGADVSAADGEGNKPEKAVVELLHLANEPETAGLVRKHRRRPAKRAAGEQQHPAAKPGKRRRGATSEPEAAAELERDAESADEDVREAPAVKPEPNDPSLFHLPTDPTPRQSSPTPEEPAPPGIEAELAAQRASIARLANEEATRLGAALLRAAAAESDAAKAREERKAAVADAARARTERDAARDEARQAVGERDEASAEAGRLRREVDAYRADREAIEGILGRRRGPSA
ncbi:ankyrin repeat-containing domain protein [Hyaloraphidium curvatum]|nr:ankyrin repeat-containing domain protein [Hyaloraphidium curvatum]